MASREEKLCNFYSKCIEKEYTDMSDDTQSLKAKVIATDLGLRYGKIGALFEEAKAVFEATEARKKAAEEKAAAEAVRAAVPGDLVVILKEESKSIEVFRRPDKSIYCTHNGGEEKFEGAPDIEVRKGGVLTYTYHPSKTVFTGASSGGIAMGGFHQTEAYSTEKVSQSGKGDIHAKSGGMDIWVKVIHFSDATDKAFRRDDIYNSLSRGKDIICYDPSGASLSRGLMDMAVQNRSGYQDMMSKASMAVDMMRLPMGQIQQIGNFLNSVIAGKYPETDEEMYKQALSLSAADKSDDLLRAVQIFQKINDYKDSSERAAEVQKKYEEVLQAEKEHKILEKEARGKKIKMAVMIAVPFIAVAAIAYTVVRNQARKDADYNIANSLMGVKRYDEAISAYAALDGYKDSEELITECRYLSAMDVINYLEFADPQEMILKASLPEDQVDDENLKRISAAKELFEQEVFLNACGELESLGDYKDSKDVLARVSKQAEAVKVMFKSFKEAAPYAEGLPEGSLLTKSIRDTISMYEPYIGKFYWMGSEAMAVDLDFRMFKRDYTQVGWEHVYARVKQSNGGTISFPLVKLNGRNFELFNTIKFKGLSADGDIQDVIHVKVNLRDGYIIADMYYDSAGKQKLGDCFYACPDDPALKSAAENYYKAQKEIVNTDLAERYIKEKSYREAQIYIDQLPDSSKKQAMLAEIEPYLPYLGTWELISGEPTLLNDEKNQKKKYQTIRTDTATSKYTTYPRLYIRVFNAEGDLGQQFDTTKTPFETTPYLDKDASRIQYFLSVTDSGNLLVTEVKNGKRSTAEYKRIE